MKIRPLMVRQASSDRQRRLRERGPRRAAPSTVLENAARRLLRPAEVSADGRLVVQARTALPTDHGSFDVRLFQFDGRPGDHLALTRGDLSGDAPVLLRLHSECFTGEVLGSMRCECGDQLSGALQAVQAEGRGLVLYLRQEGRGIGLANKLRAYALQEMGADTVDANRLLGLPDDARTYEMAAEMLRHLGIRSVRLMTNNPAKVRALETLGITVAERVPLVVPQNALAASYLSTKRDRMEHIVP